MGFLQSNQKLRQSQELAIYILIQTSLPPCKDLKDKLELFQRWTVSCLVASSPALLWRGRWHVLFPHSPPAVLPMPIHWVLEGTERLHGRLSLSITIELSSWLSHNCIIIVTSSACKPTLIIVGWLLQPQSRPCLQLFSTSRAWTRTANAKIVQSCLHKYKGIMRNVNFLTFFPKQLVFLSLNVMFL